REYRGFELRVRSGAVSDGAQTRAIIDRDRRLGAESRAAAAIIHIGQGISSHRSLASFQFQPQRAAFGEVRIVVESRDLQPSQLEPAGVERRTIWLSLASKRRDLDRVHARDRLRGLVYRAEKNRLAESEIVGMKDSAP